MYSIQSINRHPYQHISYRDCYGPHVAPWCGIMKRDQQNSIPHLQLLPNKIVWHYVHSDFRFYTSVQTCKQLQGFMALIKVHAGPESWTTATNGPNGGDQMRRNRVALSQLQHSRTCILSVGANVDCTCGPVAVHKHCVYTNDSLKKLIKCVCFTVAPPFMSTVLCHVKNNKCGSILLPELFGAVMRVRVAKNPHYLRYLPTATANGRSQQMDRNKSVLSQVWSNWSNMTSLLSKKQQS